MNRRHFIGGTSASLVAAAVSYVALVQPGDEQIIELATQVADLDARVDALETQVAAIGGTSAPAESTPVATASTQVAATGGIVIDGVGTTISDPFHLAAGRYRVHVTVQERKDGFASILVEAFDPSGASEEVVGIINQSSESADGWAGSVLYHAPADGDYFISVARTNDPWSVVFEAF